MHYNYKSDKKILKTLIHRNILPTDPNKKIKLIIYHKKFKTSSLVIKINSFEWGFAKKQRYISIVSERCIVSLHDRVVEVKLTYI